MKVTIVVQTAQREVIVRQCLPEYVDESADWGDKIDALSSSGAARSAPQEKMGVSGIAAGDENEADTCRPKETKTQ
jgi:hypothetical protein